MQDNPEKSINRVVSNAKAGAKGGTIRTGDARRAGTSNPGRSKSSKKGRKDKKPLSILPVFFGMAVAFVIGAAIFGLSDFHQFQ